VPEASETDVRTTEALNATAAAQEGVFTDGLAP
jgi:hypothetical protein